MGVRSRIARRLVKSAAKTAIGGSVVRAVSRGVRRITPAPIRRFMSRIPSMSNVERSMGAGLRRVARASRLTPYSKLPKPKLTAFGKLRRVAGIAGSVAGAGLLGYSVYDAIKGSRASSGGSIGSAGAYDSAYDTTGTQQFAPSEDTMGFGSRLALGAAGLGGLYAAEQLAENLGVRGGAGFIGDRPLTSAQIRRMTGFGGRRKTGLFNKRALRTMMKAKSYEKQAVRVLSKRGLVFKKRGSGARPSIDAQEARIARMLYGRGM